MGGGMSGGGKGKGRQPKGGQKADRWIKEQGSLKGYAIKWRCEADRCEKGRSWSGKA